MPKTRSRRSQEDLRLCLSARYRNLRSPGPPIVRPRQPSDSTEHTRSTRVFDLTALHLRHSLNPWAGTFAEHMPRMTSTRVADCGPCGTRVADVPRTAALGGPLPVHEQRASQGCSGEVWREASRHG